MTINLETETHTYFHPRYIYIAGPWFYIFLQSKYPKKKEKKYRKYFKLLDFPKYVFL